MLVEGVGGWRGWRANLGRFCLPPEANDLNDHHRRDFRDLVRDGGHLQLIKVTDQLRPDVHLHFFGHVGARLLSAKIVGQWRSMNELASSTLLGALEGFQRRPR